MYNEVKRKAEIYLADKLTTLVPGHLFVPWKGGTEETDEELVEPPFTVIGINEADKVHPIESIFRCEGVLQIISHSAEHTSREHSDLVRRIYHKLKALPNQVITGFVFHGLDINVTESAEDEEESIWADLIRFTMGVSLKETSTDSTVFTADTTLLTADTI